MAINSTPKNNPGVLYVVIPCYNEEEGINETASQLKVKINKLIKAKKISQKSHVVFVDDGSKDKTWNSILRLSKSNDLFKGIKLSRNKGHQNALLAGLLTVSERCDFVISMDADLQDDINAIDSMIDAYYNGSDIVYGVRSERSNDTLFKRTSALGFYKLMHKMGIESVYNHADYRLMSKRVIVELSHFREVNLFLRGIIPLIGFRYSVVEYSRGERFAGESKYPLRKMLNFAIDGITSFSIKPLRFVTGLGLTISVISLIVMVYSLCAKLFGQTIDGWTFTVISVWFIGGVQMLSLGIVGEYIGKIYNEVKQRPRYIIDEEV